MAKKILFQGDSITDCGRSRENLADAGKGYPLLVKASLGCECPEEYEFINRGNSGNRIVDLYARKLCRDKMAELMNQYRQRKQQYAGDYVK